MVDCLAGGQLRGARGSAAEMRQEPPVRIRPESAMAGGGTAGVDGTFMAVSRVLVAATLAATL